MGVKLYIGNVFFEQELERGKGEVKKSPLHLFSDPLFQLQYLPLLIMDDQNEIVIGGGCDREYFSRLCEFGLPDFRKKTRSVDEPAEKKQVVSWGYSPSIANWAKEKGANYLHPPWSIVRLLNSKEFSSHYYADSYLIRDKKDLDHFWNTWERPFVLKHCFGFSGRGKVIVINDLEKIQAEQFCQRAWNREEPVIVEPWQKRVLDFSSHWQIHADQITFLGFTTIENNKFGAFQSSISGKKQPLLCSYNSYGEKHLEEARNILTFAKEKEYFGPVSFDGYLFEEGDEVFLRPIVEINARMTMSSIALLFQHKYYKNQTLKVEYTNLVEGKKGLLPGTIIKHNNKKIKCNKQMYFRIVP